ncbi:oocyte zinc finger protein XlCOF6 [Asbolus verrucosus]|uniref:Oocyte zinc finger protein XlCOF6 n=1 Tax=Asbolus verrucosus TaxID=1661398 RepID=A0A482VDD0_ASBVE|nr:oocyte zinc finger protein XlCOF6 [Asbolus verrucosus]
MDTEDEPPAYLKFFNDGPHNYLLHSSEDGLNDAFPVESIFTEIASDWSSEGFPILLSGSLIADDNDSESTSTNVQLFSEENENSTLNEDLAEDNTVTIFSNIDKNRLILSKDVLLRVEEVDDNETQESTVTHVINGDTSITYAQDGQEDVNEAETNGMEVIQLLNIDGTVTTINKNLLNIVDEKDKINNFTNFYTQIQANKCKLCPFLCETVEEITAHINLKHAKEIQQNNVNGVVPSGRIVDSDLIGTKMTSILNMNKNKKYTLYLCSDCGSGYSNKEDLKQHMISQHNMVYASTTPDNKTSNSQFEKSKTVENEQNKLSSRAISASLLKKQQKTMRRIKCSIKGCPLRFDKEELRKRHEDCHVDQQKKQFMCPVCKEKFSIWRICSMHLWKCHSIDLGLLTCPMCNQFKSNSAVRVINHMAIHNEEKPFICTSCGKRFKQLNQLRNHELIHKSPEEVPNCYSRKQCEFCDRYFANSKCLKKHIKFVHDKFKPFICNICGHQTARKEMLQLHHRQHTGDKPYHCSYCEYKTGDRNCLRKHTMRHFGKDMYSNDERIDMIFIYDECRKNVVAVTNLCRRRYANPNDNIFKQLENEPRLNWSKQTR